MQGGAGGIFGPTGGLLRPAKLKTFSFSSTPCLHHELTSDAEACLPREVSVASPLPAPAAARSTTRTTGPMEHHHRAATPSMAPEMDRAGAIGLRFSEEASPKSSWPRHALRLLHIWGTTTVHRKPCDQRSGKTEVCRRWARRAGHYRAVDGPGGWNGIHVQTRGTRAVKWGPRHPRLFTAWETYSCRRVSHVPV